jgi:hypothetical protein
MHPNDKGTSFIEHKPENDENKIDEKWDVGHGTGHRVCRYAPGAVCRE